MSLCALFAVRAAAELTAPATIPAPAPGPAVKVASVVIIDGKTVNLKVGDPAPVLSAGQKVTVVSGEVSFVTPGDTVVASAGSGFSLSPAGEYISVTCTAGKVTVMDPTGTTETLSKGSTANVAQNMHELPGEYYWVSLPQQSTVQNSKNPASATTP